MATRPSKAEINAKPNKAEAQPVMGRPTDFTPAIGEEILAQMAEGLSLAAAAAELGIHRQRVYDWEKKHPEFADTIKLARSKRQLFLERRLLKADQGPIVTSTIFALKNAAGDDWREKVTNEHTGKDGGAIKHETAFDLSALTDDELAAYKLLASAAGRNRAGD